VPRQPSKTFTDKELEIMRVVWQLGEASARQIQEKLAGEQHYITFHLALDGDAWRIDTDLLEILIERLGTIAEVVRPLSQQG